MAILVGLFAAVVVIFLVESFSHMMYAMPEGLDVKDKEAMDAWIKTLPFGALLIVLLAWFFGATVGGFVASFMDRINALRNAQIVGVFLLVATLINLYQIPNPIWMWICGII